MAWASWRVHYRRMGMKSGLACFLAFVAACKSQKPEAKQDDPWASGTAAAPGAAAGGGGGEKKWYEGAAPPVGLWMGLDNRLAPTTTADGTTYLNSKLQLA